jgi:uncharacterized Zn-finger protein
MGDEYRIVEVATRTVHCEGRPERAHKRVEIALEPNAVAACPICERRFRAVGSTRIDPAAWPREG